MDFYLIVGIYWHEFLSKCSCVQLEINVFGINLILFEKTTCPERLSTSTLAVIPKQDGNPHPSGLGQSFRGNSDRMALPCVDRKLCCEERAEGNVMPNMTFRAGCQIQRMALEIGTLSLP